MFNYIMNHQSSVIVGFIVLCGISILLNRMIRNKKNHKSSCGCGCGSCESAGICHQK